MSPFRAAYSLGNLLCIALLSIAIDGNSASADTYKSICSFNGKSHELCEIKETNASLNGMKGHLLSATVSTKQKAEVFWSQNNNTHYIKNQLGKWMATQMSCSFDNSGTFCDYANNGTILLSVKADCGE